MVELKKFNILDYLQTEEAQRAYLEEVAKENDPASLLKALSDVARARGMTKTAKETGITRQGLYEALSENGNPNFENFNKIVNALGLRISFVPLT